MSDYTDFLLYGSLESSDSDDSDYSPSQDSQESSYRGFTSTQDSQSERTLISKLILKLYYYYNIYGL